MRITNKLTLIAGLVASSFTLNANAGIVTNATDILTGTGHAQLSEWLGQDVDLTRIFAKGVDGISSYDWHAAVDNQGATFTVMEVFDNDTNERRVIGGYNNNSWSSSSSRTNSTTAFLFNLSNGLRFNKHNYYKNGGGAVYNGSNNGVVFGYGGDLLVNSDLTTGRGNIGYTYGDRTLNGSNAYREEFAGSLDNWTIGAYETFTLSDSTGSFGSGASALITESGKPNNVPVPFAFAGLSLLGLCFARRK